MGNMHWDLRIFSGMIRYFCICSLFFSTNTGCNNADGNSPTADCATVLCTAEFRIISVGVQDKAGVNIPLDDFIVTDAQSGMELTQEYSQEQLEIFQQTGTYPLYNDSFRETHINKTRGLIFKGFINREVVVMGTYLVFADCCHVQLDSGDEILYID